MACNTSDLELGRIAGHSGRFGTRISDKSVCYTLTHRDVPHNPGPPDGSCDSRGKLLLGSPRGSRSRVSAESCPARGSPTAMPGRSGEPTHGEPSPRLVSGGSPARTHASHPARPPRPHPTP